MSAQPLIVDIKRGSVEDGPGIRSVVFFKGCPLRCVFCQNPETQEPGPEVAFFEQHCIACGDCVKVCPNQAIDIGARGRIHRERCTRCGACAQACPTGGLRLIGSAYPAAELAEILLRDKRLYQNSGGGVTLSGGECGLHPEYVGELLALLKAEGIHIAIETSCCFEYTRFKEHVLPHTDLIFCDLKFVDEGLHRRHTGVSNAVILDNLRRLLHEEGVEVHPRVPLVPGVTATEENLSAIAEFLHQADADYVFLLPYNPMGLEMLPCLGRRRPELSDRFMKPEEEQAVRTMFQRIVQEKMPQQSGV